MGIALSQVAARIDHAYILSGILHCPQHPKEIEKILVSVTLCAERTATKPTPALAIQIDWLYNID
jgi:hypothetical protein